MNVKHERFVNQEKLFKQAFTRKFRNERVYRANGSLIKRNALLICS